MRQMIRLGLIESGLDPSSQEPQYLVSNVLRPHLARALDDGATVAAAGKAADALFEAWWTTDADD